MKDNLELAHRFQERVHTYLTAGLLDEKHDLKEDWHTFSYILSTLPINALFHITDSRNVQSIFEHGGLMSSASLTQVCRAMPKTESNDNFVHHWRVWRPSQHSHSYPYSRQQRQRMRTLPFVS